MKLKDLIVFENDDFIALNKPSGLLSIPDREGKELSLKKLLQEAYGQIYVVHRLDRDTSGIILFAKNEATHKYLSQQFEHRETVKIYNGLVLGSPLQKSGTINAPIAESETRKGVMIIHRRGKESVTDYEVLNDYRIYAWMQFRIHTGRTHQIRIHMKDLGHPIVCDPVYGDSKPVLLSSLKKKYNLSKKEEEERPVVNRLALHAAKISFTGADKKSYTLEAPLHKDLRALLNQLEKNKSGK